jgi:hypothetical protein
VRSDVDAAAAAFARLGAASPEDPCVAFHLKRLAKGIRDLRLVATEK